MRNRLRSVERKAEKLLEILNAGQGTHFYSPLVLHLEMAADDLLVQEPPNARSGYRRIEEAFNYCGAAGLLPSSRLQPPMFPSISTVLITL